MSGNLLNNLVEKLYHARGNFLMCSKTDLNQEDLQNLLDTPSKHKNLVKWWNLTNCWYITVKLTNLWINYFENWFKFDKEKETKNIVINTLNNHWNFSLENNWNQNIQNINNEIDKIIELLDTKNIEKKYELKKLLEEFKETQDKNKLEKVLTNLASISWIWSLITSIISLF